MGGMGALPAPPAAEAMAAGRCMCEGAAAIVPAISKEPPKEPRSASCSDCLPTRAPTAPTPLPRRREMPAAAPRGSAKECGRAVCACASSAPGALAASSEEPSIPLSRACGSPPPCTSRLVVRSRNLSTSGLSSCCSSMKSAVITALTCSRLTTSALSRIMMEDGYASEGSITRRSRGCTPVSLRTWFRSRRELRLGIPPSEPMLAHVANLVGRAGTPPRDEAGRRT
mmetsp:Transcript_1946/g.4861  ORF Transcript_1946/g.4861 Transcript_1946/m.4861 type:complete len:227 (-) Transcript_1946:487-1167(-)